MLHRLEGKTFRHLTPKEMEVLRAYRSGRLRKEANKLTMISGHGRLKRKNETFVDIGGSTGGFVRKVLYDWRPPDLASFEGDWRLALSDDRRRSLSRRS